MYESTWSRIEKPEDMAGPFARQSNWYRIGMMLAERLDDAGRRVEASRLRTTLRKSMRECEARP